MEVYFEWDMGVGYACGTWVSGWVGLTYDYEILKPKPAPAVSSGPAPVRLPNGTAEDKRVSYSTIASFGWDQDEYGKDPQNVYVHIMSGVDGIGQLKERVSCDFTKRSFDLKIEP